MTGRRVLAVVVIAALAGCGGFSPVDGGTETPTVTPAPVPGQDEPRVEGVGNDGIEPEVIVANHRTALANASYTITETFRVGADGNLTFAQRMRASVGPGWRRFRIEDNVSAADPRYLGRGTDVWWNGERAYYRYGLKEGEYTYYVVESRPSNPLRIDGRLEDLLRSLSVSSIERGPDGSVVVAGYLEDRSAVPQMVYLRGVENATMTIRIGSDGVVDRMAVGYDALHRDDGRFQVRYTYRITAVGSTDVEPPRWLDEFDDREVEAAIRSSP